MDDASTNPWPTEGIQMTGQNSANAPDPSNEPIHEHTYQSAPTNFSEATFHDMARAIASLGDQHRLYADNQQRIGLAFESVTAHLSQLSEAFAKLNAAPAAPAAVPSIPAATHSTNYIHSETPRSVARFREPRVFDG